MSDHLSAQTVDQYRRRVMSPADLLAAGDHLANCDDCRRLASEALPMDSIVSSLHVQLQSGVTGAESEHLSYEQLAALVDNEVDVTDRVALEGHLESCSLCAAEVKDLTAFRSETHAAPVKTLEPATRPSLWKKISASLPVPVAQRPMLAAAFALLLVSVSVGLFFVWRANRPTTSPQHAGVEVPQGSKPESGDTSVPQASPSQQDAAPESRTIVSLSDGGGNVTLDDAGNVSGLESLAPSSRQAVKQALTAERVEVPAGLSELSGTKGTLLGPADQGGFSLLSPIGTITRSDRPALRWRRLSGATSYTVAILDADFNSVMTSPALTGTQWTPAKTLQRGRVYSWQVTAVKDGKEIISPSAPAPEARFKVLDKAKADELRNVEKTAGDSHLARGTLYARAGLLDDAERELRALVAANPQSSTARKLLQSLQSIRKR